MIVSSNQYSILIRALCERADSWRDKCIGAHQRCFKTATFFAEKGWGSCRFRERANELAVEDESRDAATPANPQGENSALIKHVEKERGVHDLLQFQIRVIVGSPLVG